MYKMLKGNEASAYAAMLASVDVIPAYPITPSTLFPEKISQFLANNEMDAAFIPVESEHSAMSAAIGASATGARVMTATSSQGLAYMHEMLPIASGMRMPIVMAIGNRALSAPLNIWNDQQDSISERDSGWLQFYAENNQEVLDLILLAFKISENKNVLLPSMVCMDAFLLTHVMEPVEVPEKQSVMDFVGKKEINYPIVDVNKPATLGSFAGPDYYTEFRYQVSKAMEGSVSVIDHAFAEFSKKFKRHYSRVEAYKAEDAEFLYIAMGSISGTIKEAVDILRENGVKAGLLRIITFRPFPSDILKKYLAKNVKVAVIDRNVVPGAENSALSTELKAMLYSEKEKAEVKDVIIGLGGRDVTIDNIKDIYYLYEKGKEPVIWLQLKKELVEVMP